MKGRSREARKWLALAAVLIAVVVCGFLLLRPAAARGRERREVAPAFRAPTLIGDTLSLSDYRGRVVLLNFWATWCPPCRAEMPAVQRAYERFGKRGFAVVSVSEDEDPSRQAPVARIRDFVLERATTFPVLLDPTGRVQQLYGVEGIPTSLLLDRQGHIVRRVLGPAEWDRPPYSTEIERLLAE